MIVSIAEVLKKAAETPNRKDKIKILQENDSRALRVVLKFAFDPEVVWLLPQGKVPYEPCNLPDQHGTLIADLRKLLIFVKGEYDNLPKMKRESLFINFMESLDPLDAQLIEYAKDKKLPYDTITPSLVQEAFPGLLSEVKTESNTHKRRNPTRLFKSNDESEK